MSSRKRNPIADRIVAAIVSALGWIVRSVPRYVMLGMGSAFGLLIWWFLKLERKRLAVTIENLRNLYPGAPEEELRALTKRVCRSAALGLLEFMRLPLFDRGSFCGRIRFEGLEHLIDAYNRGKGVIVATGHFGNFEVGSGVLALMGYPIWSVIRTVDNPYLDLIMDKTRESTGLKVIKKENAAKDILRRLREGNVIMILYDHHAAFNNMFVPLFGKLAATFTTPAIMSLRTGAAIIPMFCFRDDVTDSYTVKIFSMKPIVKTGDISADVRQITTWLNETLEDAVREAPDQWLWIHRRWKMVPDEADLKKIEHEQALIDMAVRKNKADAARRG